MLSDYIALIQSFVDGSIKAAEFERRFLDKYKADQEIPPEEEFQALETLFGAVDAYVGDLPVTDPRFDLDEAALREYAERALEQLIKIQAKEKRN